MKLSFITLAALSMSILIGCDTSTPTEKKSQEATTTETTSQTAETPIEQTNSGPTYRVGTMAAYPPFATTNEYGNPDGFDIAIMKAIAKEQVFNIQFIIHPWEDLKSDIVTKKVDIWAAGISIKESRKEFSSFSDPYILDATTILTRDDETSKDINEDNLKNYKVGVEKGSTNVMVAERITGDTTKVKLFKTNYQAFEALLQNKIDAIIGSESLLAYMSKSFPEYKFKEQEIKGESDIDKQLGFMVQKDKTEIVNELNEGLKAIKANGEFDKIKQKWFGDLVD